MRLSNGFCDLAIDADPLWNHTLAESPEIVDRFRYLLDEGVVMMSFHEVVNLYRIVARTNRLPGDIAEVGTADGGSALVMAMANPAQKKMHLFDTFRGIPESTPGVDLVNVGDIRGLGLDMVKWNLRNYADIVEFHVGVFPETTQDMDAQGKYCMVNLDMDVYESTKAGFQYFYPRMTRGGAIVCHDYFSKSCPGVRKAVDEFFSDKPETLVDLWHTQIVMIKM